MVCLLRLCLMWKHCAGPQLNGSPVKKSRAMSLSHLEMLSCFFFCVCLKYVVGTGQIKKRMCHLFIMLPCCLSPTHFHFSASLVNCEAVGVSKPSNPFSGGAVRQQKLRCPFLVISGGNECYHNPHSLTLSSPLLLSVPCQPPVELLCSVVQRLFTKLLSIFIVRPSICPPLAPLRLCQCQYALLFFPLLLLCFDWPFSVPVALHIPLLSMACLVVLLWSGTLRW